jgi:alkanesulfonate monooxygenase SsuD/methylene tetrahydromethanopterin reductase-like flavin-dependent oxidoreductase (luciferase family)
MLVGAGGPRMLRVAARHADLVGLWPAPIKNSQDRDDPRDLLPAALDQKIETLRAEAGDRFPELELSAFVTIRITRHRRSDTENSSPGVAGAGSTSTQPGRCRPFSSAARPRSVRLLPGIWLICACQ